MQQILQCMKLKLNDKSKTATDIAFEMPATVFDMI